MEASQAEEFLEGELAIVQSILKDTQYNTAVINYSGVFQNSPLKLASYNGHIEIMELLLSNGAEIEVRDILGCTPLVSASGQGQTEAMEVLIQHGVDIEAEDRDGDTPLLHAIKKSRIGAMEVLLSRGAKVYSKVSDQDLPLVSAIRNWDTGAMENWLTLNRDKSYNPYNQEETLLQWAIGNCEYHFMKLLLHRGADIERRDNNGATPLSWACKNASQYNFVKAMEVLLHNGAQVDAKENNGMTSLALACRSGFYFAAKTLLDHSASAQIKDQEGRLPLEHALYFLYNARQDYFLFWRRLGMSTVHSLLKNMYIQKK